ncbi:MAG: ABC transporter permease [Candidatus Heimdallarchaeota archaeon]|nr:ABC transporter permease [Candidatus Heimdallarchaeota archaeon]MDH5647945.1 ABC transporter permease [Candidatus Heimdallarchaeota archaeon]
MVLIQAENLFTPSSDVHSISKSTTVSTFHVIKSSIRLNLTIWKRYKANLIGGLFETAIFAGMFLLFATAATFRNFNLDDRGMMIFFQSALVLFIFNSVALWSPINAVTRDLNNGTLEFIYSNPSSRYGYFVGIIISEAIVKMMYFIPMYLFLLSLTHLSGLDILYSLLVILIVIISLSAFGILIALAAILWKQTSSISQLIGTLFQFLSGTFFPITVFPVGLQFMAYFFPFTFGYDLLRYYSFNGNWETIFPVYVEWILLFIYSIIYTLIAKRLLRKVESYAKVKGLHLL